MEDLGSESGLSNLFRSPQAPTILPRSSGTSEPVDETAWEDREQVRRSELNARICMGEEIPPECEAAEPNPSSKEETHRGDKVLSRVEEEDTSDVGPTSSIANVDEFIDDSDDSDDSEDGSCSAIQGEKSKRPDRDSDDDKENEDPVGNQQWVTDQTWRKSQKVPALRSYEDTFLELEKTIQQTTGNNRLAIAGEAASQMKSDYTNKPWTDQQRKAAQYLGGDTPTMFQECWQLMSLGQKAFSRQDPHFQGWLQQLVKDHRQDKITREELHTFVRSYKLSQPTPGITITEPALPPQAGTTEDPRQPKTARKRTATSEQREAHEACWDLLNAEQRNAAEEDAEFQPWAEEIYEMYQQGFVSTQIFREEVTGYRHRPDGARQPISQAFRLAITTKQAEVVAAHRALDKRNAEMAIKQAKLKDEEDLFAQHSQYWQEQMEEQTLRFQEQAMARAAEYEHQREQDSVWQRLREENQRQARAEDEAAKKKVEEKLAQLARVKLLLLQHQAEFKSEKDKVLEQNRKMELDMDRARQTIHDNLETAKRSTDGSVPEYPRSRRDPHITLGKVTDSLMLQRREQIQNARDLQAWERTHGYVQEKPRLVPLKHLGIGPAVTLTLRIQKDQTEWALPHTPWVQWDMESTSGSEARWTKIRRRIQTATTIPLDSHQKAHQVGNKQMPRAKVQQMGPGSIRAQQRMGTTSVTPQMTTEVLKIIPGTESGPRNLRTMREITTERQTDRKVHTNPNQGRVIRTTPSNMEEDLRIIQTEADPRITQMEEDL